MADEDKNTDTPDPTEPGGRLDPERWKAKYGDAEAALARMANKLDQVEADNKKYRDRIGTLEEQVPDESAEVLEGDEAERYRSVEAGEGSTALETLQSQVEDREAAQKQLAEYERKEEDRRVAKAEGITDLDAFRDLRNGEVFSFRKEENDDGETVERAFVAPDEDTEPVRVRDYDRFKRFENTLWGETAAPEPQRPSVPNQRPGGNAPSDEKSDAEIKSEQKKRHRFSI